MIQQNMFDNEIRLGVSQFNELVNLQLQNLGELIIEGEITEFNISRRQGVNIVLKDRNELAVVSVTGYAPRIEGINLVEAGMQVAIWGSPQLYSPYGKFSVSIYKILPIGEGALNKAFEILKNKLDTEGLFNPDRKRPLPQLVKNIALITAKDSAAQGDFYKILKENNSGINVDFYPVAVQGKHAISEILSAIKKTQEKKYDSVVLIRGGGSLEDLSAFNDESVTRAIFACKNITLVAVGHERDESISEYAADIRASTPSQAAYYLVVNNTKFITGLELQVEQMHAHLQQSITYYNEYVGRYDLRNEIFNLFRLYESKLLNFNYDIESKLGRVVEKYLSLSLSMEVSLVNFENYIKSIIKQVHYLENILASYNPINVVKRGYAIVRNTKGKIITSVTQVEIGQPIELTLKNGKLKTSINSVETNTL